MNFIPPTRARVLPTCGRCLNCHPGKAWGGDESCRVLNRTTPTTDCPCHRKKET